jgi:hypothetical protein
MEDKYLMAQVMEDAIRHMLVGNSLEHARNLLSEIDSKLYIRVVKENGVNYIVTCDFVTERINVHVENGIITEVDGLG